MADHASDRARSRSRDHRARVPRPQLRRHEQRGGRAHRPRARGIPTELPLGPDDGMPEHCAAGFDTLRVIPRAYLVARIRSLDAVRMAETCRALRVAPSIADPADELGDGPNRRWCCSLSE